MLRNSRPIVFLIIAILVAPSAVADDPAVANVLEVHGYVPLGSESFRIEGQKQTFSVLATAQMPEWEGMKVVGAAGHRRVLDRVGAPVRMYPQQVKFRVTATGRVKLYSDEAPALLPAKAELEPLLRSLSFELKIFHGLQVRTLKPAEVRMIGVPADVPYDERVYQVDFNVGPLPIDRQIVLEVLRPDGSRMCKFHLEFN